MNYIQKIIYKKLPKFTRTCHSESMTKPLFIVQNLTKSYQTGENEIQALKGVSFNLYPGEFIVLLGPSGSGKSTLLNILGGLDVPTAGSVVYEDHQLVGATEKQLTEYRRDHVGFVFQFFNLIHNLNAIENVQLAADLSRNSMKPIEALQLVGLKDRASHFPSQLSGGEQQRVSIARAIAKRPNVLLCDEPTGALDIRTGKLVLEAICRINKELGTLAVVITHNTAIAGLADRVLRLSDGKLVEESRTSQKISVDEVHW
ncbi:MAG TPA: ABC transporter ATP-binding protein [Pseudobdellovibrionaceae bacterium]|nr:ABC transporter ATP-binding protein [Pseudobdellovibrionaceae bacterium]